MGVVVGMLVYSTHVHADENPRWPVNVAPPLDATVHSPVSVDAATPVPVTNLPISAFYMPVNPLPPGFSAQDFRPRGSSLSAPAAASLSAETPNVRGTVWQRLSEFRAHNRVRLLTLWETKGTSLSLQAGRRGDPSLQWTTGFAARSRTPPALLDEIFSSSSGGGGVRDLHIAPRFSNVSPASKPIKPAEISMPGTAVK